MTSAHNEQLTSFNGFGNIDSGLLEDYSSEEDFIGQALRIGAGADGTRDKHIASNLLRTASRRISRSDANSIVGGDSLASIHDKNCSHDLLVEEHPILNPALTTQDQDFEIEENDGHIDRVEADKNRVFSFSLPFGGFSGVRSSIFRQLALIKLDNLHLPSIGGTQQSEADELKEVVLTKLRRQESIETMEDASFFRDVKSLEGLRFKAVKQSISHNINDFLPDFKTGKREECSPELVFESVTGNIIVMGGYRGSILRDAKTHKRVWIPLKAGLGLRRINLLLGPHDYDEINAKNLIYPDGMLKNIGPIDISNRLIKKLSNNPKTNVKEFGYDWRLSGPFLARKLEEYMQEIKDQTGQGSIVIAHSMGGLIAHGALQLNPKLFRGIVYVGVPSECLNMLGPIRFGDSVMFSDKILRAETNFMMRSSFLFLPLSGRVFANKTTKEYYDLDFFDPKVWVDYDLNPLVSSKRQCTENSKITGLNTDSKLLTNAKQSIAHKFRSLTSHKIDFGSIHRTFPTSHIGILQSNSSVMMEDELADNDYALSFTQAYEYLSRTLRETKEYLLSLEYRKDLATEYPPMVIVYGNQVPSVRGSLVSCKQDIREGNYYHFYYGHGDGVVHQKWLMPERKGFTRYMSELGEGLIVGKFSSPYGHVSLLTDMKVMLNAIKAIVDAEAFWPTRQGNQLNSKA